MTCESGQREVEALVALCAACGGSRIDEWTKLLGNLAVGEAVVLPVPQEAEGEARRIHLAPRLTPHVRHLAKYVDIPVSAQRAFVFNGDSTGSSHRARTLREFVAVVEEKSPAALRGHLLKSDFSRWIADIFGDYTLAKDIARLEEEYRTATIPDIGALLGRAVRARYEFVEPVRPSRS